MGRDLGGGSGRLADVAVGTRVAGYLLEEQVGAGGMAVVFRARDERLGRRVALKVLAPALAADQPFRQRFVRESRAAAAVDDPHIIPVYDAGEADGMLYIAMRYVPGGDVGSLLRREGPLAPARAVAICSAVASALDTAHEAGLVHRDVKPTNMLVDLRPGRRDHVYLSDFGLSKGTLSSAGLTGSGLFLGTLDYSAPEQIDGGALDGRADEYALACSVFELLTGAPPFKREQATAVIWAHMSQPPPLLTSRRADLPPAADAVLAKALAKSPADRYPTCREFADMLLGALGTTQHDTARKPAYPRTELARPAVPRAGTGATGIPSDARTAETVSAGLAALAGRTIATPEGPDRGHRGVTAVAFRPGIPVLATGHENGSTYLWDLATGGMSATLAGPGPGGTEALAFLPDGSMLATGHDDGSTCLWDMATASLTATLAGPGAVEAVAFLPGGSVLATGHDDGSTCLWDMGSHAAIATLQAPGAGSVSGVAFSPDGMRLATGHDDGRTCLWDVASHTAIATFQVPGAGTVSGVAFSPDGLMLATGDLDGGAYLWDSAGDRATLADARSAGVFAVAFAPDGLVLATGGANGSTDLWDTRRERKLAALAESGSLGVWAVAFSPDGLMLAAGDGNGRAYLWSWDHRARHRGLARSRPLILQA